MSAKIYFDNAKMKYKAGAFIKGKLKGKDFEALWVPLSAVFDLGKMKMAWLKRNSNFSAVKVETGVRAGDMIEISDGLTEEDEIALDAHYLTDSDGFIKENDHE
jgi:Cu(I)/Ag(I) efflux system membrane fusion protein